MGCQSPTRLPLDLNLLWLPDIYKPGGGKGLSEGISEHNVNHDPGQIDKM